VLRIGFTYNLKRIIPGDDYTTDQEAEYDSPKTIEAISMALKALGHEVVELEATSDLPVRLGSTDLDLVFNIAEGLKGRNREAQVPALLELLDIPYTGSDPATLALTLDKGIAKRVVRASGIATARGQLFLNVKDKLDRELNYPLIVKPVAEGSSKGVLSTSVATNEMELRELVARILARYKQGALVEEFLPGREFTVALIGEKRPRVLPPMEIVYNKEKIKSPYPVYSYEYKLDPRGEIHNQVPAQMTAELQKDVEDVARGAFDALGCRDFARIDVRLNAEGKACFIECNPLPGLTPKWSDLCLISDAVGMDYTTLIAELVSPAIRRWREKKRLD